MRIVHTSDWHAGRIWKGQDRLGELETVLAHLAGFVERARIDLLVMSGDVFDSASPPPEAERVVSAFFRRMGAAGVPSVVIAGNHDNPARLEAWGLLAEFVGVRARGLPRRLADGGVARIETACGEAATVALLPFAPVGRIVEALDLARDESAARQKYADTMQAMLGHLASAFRADTVNLLVAHSHVSGAQASGSERVVTLGEEWAATPQALPSTAQYVALGHIHRPQRVEAAGPHTEYAGSPLQLDFGEAGEEKTFAVIEVSPGRPPRVERVPYEGGARLGTWSGTWADLEASSDALRAFGYVRVRVLLDVPMPDLNRRARQLLPNIVAVEAVSAATPQPEAAPSPLAAAPRERFRSYCLRAHQCEPGGDALALFDELYGLALQE
jgi:DNA repair protein SbcD/Mre11